MINKHLNIILKLLFLTILFLFACQPAKSQSPTGAIHALPTEITLSGHLRDGDSVGEIGMPNAYIFALANDYKTVLGYSKTKNGVYPERGSWEITGLPVNNEIILVGFHPNTKFNWVTREIKMGIFNKDVGDFIIKAGPYHDPEFGGPGGPGLLNLILHEVGVFILDNQTKSLEGLIDYLLNEAKKLDNETEINETLTYSEEEIAITSMIQEIVAASDNQDWEQMKKYFLPSSQAYLGLEEAQNNTSKPTPGTKTTSQLVINEINVNNFTAVAYCNISTIETFNGKNIRKDDAEATMFLEKVDNKWKLSKVQSKIINTIRGSGSDYIKILSVTPDSGLIDGVNTDFEVVVEYKLVSSKRGGINICFNNGKELENYYASTRNHISVDKGTGTHIFNVSEKPKNWGSLNDFKVCACLGVIGEKVNYYLDQDFKILIFN